MRSRYRKGPEVNEESEVWERRLGEFQKERGMGLEKEILQEWMEVYILGMDGIRTGERKKRR